MERVFGATLAMLIAATAYAQVQELPVSRPRPFIAAGRRLDGALASGGKSPIAAWTGSRATSAILASRLMRGRDPLDAYGIRFPIPAGMYADEAAVATAGNTAVAAVRIWGVKKGTNEVIHRIAVFRMTKGGKLLDDDLHFLGDGENPVIATTGKTFAIAYPAYPNDGNVEIKVLSAQLKVLDQATFAGSTPQLAANGSRYLFMFAEGERARAVPIVNGAIARRPFNVARIAWAHPSIALTASGSSWTAALINDSLQVCDVGLSGASCRKAAEADRESHVGEIAEAGDALVIAWHQLAGYYPGDPPGAFYRLRLLRVTGDDTEELSTRTGAAPAGDDILLFREEGEAMRVGRTGIVAYIPFAPVLTEQTLYGLLPTGDGATAFWREAAATGDRSELHATRFTASGIDPRLHDRRYGNAYPLGSDGWNVLLDDGRLIAPAGNVIARVAVPKGAWLGRFDGKQWVFVSEEAIIRGAETLKRPNRSPADLACTKGACLVVWSAEERTGDRPTMGASAIYLDAERPLTAARPQVLAVGIRFHEVPAGAAAAGEALLAFWSDVPAHKILGRTFDRKGRPSKPFVVASAVDERNWMTLLCGSGGGEALVVQNVWPRQQLVRLAANGSPIATWPFENASCRGVTRVGGKTLLLVERKTAVFPYVPANRAFVIFAP